MEFIGDRKILIFFSALITVNWIELIFLYLQAKEFETNTEKILHTFRRKICFSSTSLFLCLEIYYYRLLSF